MLRKMMKIIGLTALMAVTFTLTGMAQNIVKDYDNGNNNNNNDYVEDRIKIDRYLTVEIWPNHTDGEYYINDNVVLNFLTNRDAFIAIYSVDSRGRVNLLFPSEPNQDNFVEGGHTYRLPGGNDDFDFVISGPEGVENIQVIASRERFPIPDWYPTSGLVDDWDDRFDFMDYVNNRFFVRYSGQRFAYDRTAVYINEWEPDYYQPVYYPHYPSWTVYGNAYIDYPFGGTVYINGIYWGIAPLYIPRIYVGWHTITIYDYYGYCWENNIHISRYNTVVLNRTIIKTRPNVVSKYKEVRYVGYRDPAQHGYPNYKTKKATIVSKTGGKTTTGKSIEIKSNKKYVRGSTKVVKTDRGFETIGKKVTTTKKRSASGKAYESSKSSQSKKTTRSKSSGEYRSRDAWGKSSSGKKVTTQKRGTSSTKSSGILKKKSGSSTSKGKSSVKPTYKSKKAPSSKSSGGSQKSIEKKKKSSSSSKTSSSKVEKQEKKSSSSSKTSSSKVEKQEKKSSESKTTTSKSSKKSGGSKKKRR